jgi:hypothetical protein
MNKKTKETINDKVNSSLLKRKVLIIQTDKFDEVYL